MSEINSKIPQGPLAEKWTNYKNHQKLVNPANKRRLDVIVVGTGLAGKGHEDYQEIKGVKYPMDERTLIAEVLEEIREN